MTTKAQFLRTAEMIGRGYHQLKDGRHYLDGVELSAERMAQLLPAEATQFASGSRPPSRHAAPAPMPVTGGCTMTALVFSTLDDRSVDDIMKQLPEDEAARKAAEKLRAEVEGLRSQLELIRKKAKTTDVIDALLVEKDQLQKQIQIEGRQAADAVQEVQGRGGFSAKRIAEMQDLYKCSFFDAVQRLQSQAAPPMRHFADMPQPKPEVVRPPRFAPERIKAAASAWKCGATEAFERLHSGEKPPVAQ